MSTPIIIMSDISNPINTIKVTSAAYYSHLAREALLNAFLVQQAHMYPTEHIFVPELIGIQINLNNLALILNGQLNLNYRIPIDKIFNVIYAIICTFAAAESRGIIHGNMQPENILWDLNGCPLVCGFGAMVNLYECAWYADNCKKVLHKNIQLCVPWAFNPNWSAPEMNNNITTASTSTDIYSVAKIIMYYSNNIIPDNILDIITCCLEEDPSKRTKSFNIVKQELESLQILQSLHIFTRLPYMQICQHHIAIQLLQLVIINVDNTDIEQVKSACTLCLLFAKCKYIIGIEHMMACANEALRLTTYHPIRLLVFAAEAELYLGQALLYQNKFKNAEHHLFKGIQQLLYEPNIPSVLAVRAAILETLACLQIQTGKLHYAYTTAKMALKAWETYSNEDNEGTMATLYYLGTLLMMRDELEEAYKVAVISNQMAIRCYGDMHRDTALTWHLLGCIFLKQNKLADAKHAVYIALNIRQILYPKLHPNVVASLILLGTVQYRLDNLNETKDTINDPLDMLLSLENTIDGREISSVYRRVGLLHLIKGQYNECHENLLKALHTAMYIYSINPEKTDIIAAYHTFAIYYYMRGHFQDAKVHVLNAQLILKTQSYNTPDIKCRIKELITLMAEIIKIESNEKILISQTDNFCMKIPQ